jgi:tagatose 1,6-diphosphate aldolase
LKNISGKLKLKKNRRAEMLAFSKGKMAAVKRLSSKGGIISALAIDQRGALKKLIDAAAAQGGKKIGEEGIVEFKKLVSRELTPYASAILLDPEYGLPASKMRSKNTGLLLACEKTGYDANKAGRLPDYLPTWSAKRLKEQGADSVKLLLYYDVDEAKEINDIKHAFVERLGSECAGEDVAFFLELVSYDANIQDTSTPEYARIKPHKVNEMMKEFSKSRYNVDVLKMEVPVNMKYVEGFAEGVLPVYSRKEALSYFKEQSEATHLPFIFLSAGVDAQLFQETLNFAKEAGSSFNGVLCGRATWKDGVAEYAKSEEAAVRWLQTTGRKNIQDLDAVLRQTANSWFVKAKVV